MTSHMFEHLEGRRLLAGASSVPSIDPSGVNVIFANGTPSVSGVVPRPNSTGASTLAAVKADVSLPNVGAGVSDASLRTAGAVTLTRVSDGVVIAANVNTTGGGDAIILTPRTPLAPLTQYRFNVTSAVKDTSGASFAPFTSVFTTGPTEAAADPTVRFNKIALPSSVGYQWTAMEIGPDDRLYAATRTGQIVRYVLNPDGTFRSSKTIQTVRTAHSGRERLITGIAFDPASTKTRPILWVSHGENVLEGATNFSGKISKLTGRNLETYTEVIFNLPRSARDHLTNQPKFGPDGLMYVSVGSQSAQGAPDAQWGLREETLLSAAILQINTAAITSPLNVRTTDVGGSYNPRANGAPVRLYATGVRNAYDLLWTRDGKLYAPTNSSATGGNSPAGGGAPALTAIPTVNDYLYLIEEGGYYGHPNPARGEFVLNGGNPTAGVDEAEVLSYPVGTQPNPNYRGIVYEFGRNISPNGIFEFSGSVFGRRLNNTIMVAQYSAGDNIIVLTRDSAGNITKGEAGFTGLTQFVDPLDIIQHPRTGYIYVADYGAASITLLHPDQARLLSGRRVRATEEQLVFNDVRGGGASKSRSISIWNRGMRGLTIASILPSGGNASMFQVLDAPTQPFDLGPGQRVTLRVNFSAPTGTTNGIKTSSLRIVSNDTAGDATFNIPLRGIATPGLEDANEPSLQRILSAYNLDIDVGDNDSAEANIPLPPRAGNDEIEAQAFVKAGPGWVTIEPLAVFAPNASPFVTDVGWYDSGTGAQTSVFTANSGNGQTVNVSYTGWNQLDPGNARFGIYTVWPQRNNRVTYSDDARNTWDTSSANGRKIRVYPYRRADGTVEPNAFILGSEAISTPVDHQDVVLVIRNVQVVEKRSAQSLAARAPVTGPVFSTERLDLDELV